MKVAAYPILLILISLLLFTCKRNNDDECEDMLEHLEILTNCSEQDLLTDVDTIVREIFKIVGRMPTLNGCDTLRSVNLRGECTTVKIQDFLDANIVYPSCAIENNVEGMVTVRFVVSQFGCLLDIRILEDIGYGCGKELQRVVSTMPKWIPGKQREETVRVQMNIRYEFKL